MFKVLAIDGGGIKGLYSAIILNEIEKLHGKINEHFDLICGTSTGGLIALALGNDVDLNKIIKFYSKDGLEIFPSKYKLTRGLRFIRQLLLSSKYGNKKLAIKLKDIFGNTLIDSSKNCLCIPSVDLENFKGIVFKTSHSPDLNRDKDISMIDIAMATSAAPTYFPIVPVKKVSSLCVDGGLWANNPTLVGILEALRFFVGVDKEYKSLSILSISNLSLDDGWGKKKRNASIANWNKRLISLPLNTQSKSVEEFVEIASKNKLLSIENYVRIPDPRLNKAQLETISLDRADEKAINMIEDIAFSQAHKWKNSEQIKIFFKNKIREWKFPIT